jgi:hypothetical protein
VSIVTGRTVSTLTSVESVVTSVVDPEPHDVNAVSAITAKMNAYFLINVNIQKKY